MRTLVTTLVMALKWSTAPPIVQTVRTFKANDISSFVFSAIEQM